MNSRSRPLLVVPVLPPSSPPREAAWPVPLRTTPRSNCCIDLAVASLITRRPGLAFTWLVAARWRQLAGSRPLQDSASVSWRMLLGACQTPLLATAA